MKTLDAISKYICQHNRILKIVCWVFFILLITGYCLFQRPLILNTYAAYGISDITIACLLIVLCLLPYSLSHRLKLGTAWYSLAFCPSMAIIATVSNEKIGCNTIIIIAAMLAVWLLLVIKQPRLPFRHINVNIWTLIVAAVITYTAGNTDLLAHHRHQLQHYLINNQYEKALQVGCKTTDVDSAVFNLRATAMVRTNQLADKLFCYPVPAKTTNIVADSKSNPDIMLCDLLLQKRLPEFARLLPHYYEVNSPALPQHYKEALIIYKSRTATPQITYSNAIVEANYADFLAEKKRYTSPAERKRKCYDLYGNTYFWYYHFQ